MPLPGSDIGRILKDVNWDDVAKRLLLFTLKLLKGYKFPDRDPEDFVQSAIEDLFGGRDWNPLRVDYMGFLFGSIRSEVSHGFEKLKLRESKKDAVILRSEDGQVNQPDLSADADRERRIMLDCVKDDLLLYRILAVVLDEDLYMPQEIGERLGVSSSEVNIAKRRLKTRLPNIQRSLRLPENEVEIKNRVGTPVAATTGLKKGLKSSNR